MTNPDYRALCAELLDEVAARPLILDRELIDRARAALAEPEAEGPSEKELYDLFCEYEREPVESMRAALARWGRLAAAPVPEPGEVGELAADLNEIAEILCGMEKHRWAVKLDRAATLLQQQAAVPVPVAWCNSGDFLAASAKRQSFNGWLEQHSDCDMALCIAQPPATALPLPAPEGGEVS